MHSSQITRYRMSVMSSSGGPAAAAAAAAAAAEEILIDVEKEEEEKEEEKYCFCFETEAMNGPYFQLDDCPHRLHKKCLRDILRHQWSSSAARSKVVDTEHRKVAFMMCPYCRAPLSPEVLRKLQKESKIISINEIITERGNTNLSGRHRCCCNYKYDILVKTEAAAEDTKLVTFQSYSAKNLPVMQQHQDTTSGGGDEIKFLLYQDFAVECESPLSSFTVTIRKTEPEYKIIKHFQVISKNLPSTEVDAGEEAESQRSIETYLQNNSLRIITPEIQQRDFENAVLAENLRRNITTPQFTDPPPLMSPQNIRRNRRNHPILESLLADETYSSPPSSPPLPSLEDLFETHEETTSTQQQQPQQPTTAFSSTTGYSPASPNAYYYSDESSVTDEMNTFNTTTTAAAAAAAAPYDGYSPVSPSYSPESPTPRYPTPENRPVDAGYSPISPRYTPVSPSYEPPSENRPTAVVATTGTGNRYSPMSPCYSPPPPSPPTHRPPQRSSTVTVTNMSPECSTSGYTMITLAEQHHNSSCSISLLNSSLRQPIKRPSHTVQIPQPSIPSSSSSSSSSNIAGPSHHQTTSPYFSSTSSKIPTDPRNQQKKRQKKTEEEKMKEFRHTLTSKISKLKLRVRASIYSTKTKLEALHKNIQKYHDTEQQIYQSSSSSSSYINSVSRMRIKLEKEKIAKTLNGLNFHINSLNKYF